MKKLLLPGILFTTLSAGAQLYIDNATFFIDNGAVVTVQGDVFSNTNILVNGGAGTGLLRMGGSANQNLNMNGNTVPNLQIDNSAGNVVLTGAAKVSNSLQFTTGKVQLGNFDLTLASAGTHTGAAAGKFAETNGTGLFKKGLDAATPSTTLPVGNGANYTPVQYTTVGGTYVGGTSFVAARAVGATHPNKHPRSTDYLNSYWKLSNNIVGSTITAVGNYLNPASVTGSQPAIVSLYYNGANWVKGTTQGATTVTAPLPANGSEDLYGMNKFLLVTPKVFLQGAFNTATGLMYDRLRNSGAYSPGNPSATNLLPSTDPYRSAPYATVFAHTANPVVETLTAPSVLNDLASPENQIVDWAFVELRTVSSPTVAPVTQSRSVLLQRDGDVVDIDGTSPVYFKNLDPASNYVVAIKHRNHLGLASNPASPISLGLSPTPFDFTNTATPALYFGPGTNYTSGGAPAKVLLWGGNVFLGTPIAALANYLGVNTDRGQLLLTMANPGNAPTPARTLATVGDYQTYGVGDINFDRKVDYLGVGVDRGFLLSSVLGGAPATTRSQVLPN